MLRVVIDTNVLLDGSTDDYNYGRRILDEVIAGDILAFANKATFAENRLLARQKIRDEGYLKRLDYFFTALRLVGNEKHLRIVEEDPEDNKLVEAAAAARADYLITADKHLLDLEEYQRTKIVRPGEFWNRYQDDSGQGWRKWLKDFIR